MRIIARYLLAEFLRASAGVLLGLLVMWTAADILLHIDEIAGQIGRGMRNVALRSYPVLPIAVPISCVAGAVLCLTRAARNRELTAIQTGGIRLQVALVPILAACALAAIGLAVLEDRVLVPARSALEARRVAESGEQVRTPERLLGRWWFAAPNSIFSAAAYDEKQHVLKDVSVFVFDEQRGIRERIDASSAAALDGDTWEIRDAHVLEFPPGGGVERRSQPTLRFDLGISSSEMDRASRPAWTTLHQLARQIQRNAGDAVERAKLELAFHSRLAQPFTVLIVVLLALPFATGDSQRGESLPRALLRSLLAAAGFWLAWTFALLVARSGAVAPSIAVWSVTLGALALGAWRFRRIAE